MKKNSQEQLSLFEPPKDEEVFAETTTVLDLVRARFEYGPEMTQDDYKRWVKVLVESFIRKNG